MRRNPGKKKEARSPDGGNDILEPTVVGAMGDRGGDGASSSDEGTKVTHRTVVHTELKSIRKGG
jgi:hypothetical protein